MLNTSSRKQQAYSWPRTLTKVTVGTCALGVDNTLGDALAVKMRKLVNQVEVLEQDGAEFTGSHRVLVVIDGVAYGVGSRFLLVKKRMEEV